MVCPAHSVPINTFCKDCRMLICSTCGLGNTHRSHDCRLLEDIDEEERNLMRISLQNARFELGNWEGACKTSDDSLKEELINIENQRLLLRGEVESIFSGLLSRLQQRQSELNKAIDEVSYDRQNWLMKTQDLKRTFVDNLGAFNNFESMPTFEMMTLTLYKMDALRNSLISLKNCFDHQTLDVLHNFTVTNLNTQSDIICRTVQQLGEINCPPYQQKQQQMPPHQQQLVVSRTPSPSLHQFYQQPSQPPQSMNQSQQGMMSPFMNQSQQGMMSPMNFSQQFVPPSFPSPSQQQMNISTSFDSRNISIKYKRLSGGLPSMVNLGKFTNIDDLKNHMKNSLKINENIFIMDSNNAEIDNLVQFASYQPNTVYFVATQSELSTNYNNANNIKGRKKIVWVVPEAFSANFEHNIKKNKPKGTFDHLVLSYTQFERQGAVYMCDQGCKIIYCVKTTSRIDENIFMGELQSLFGNYKPHLVISLHLANNGGINVPYPKYSLMPFKQQMLNGINEMDVSFDPNLYENI